MSRAKWSAQNKAMPASHKGRNNGGSSQFLPKKFKNEISDERSGHGNGKIDLGKNIFDSPSQAPSPLHTRARKFPHQQIGIKEEDYKTDLGYASLH